MPTLSYTSAEIQTLLDAVDAASGGGNSIATESYVDTAVADALSDLRTLVLGAYPVGEATGDPAVFSDGAAVPVKSLLVPFLPVQSGSGDPSLDNVRPITGRTGLTVSVAATAGGEPVRQIPVVWTDEAGTVYGGTPDVASGTLTVEWIAVDLASYTKIVTVAGSGSSRYFRFDEFPTPAASGAESILCDKYPFVTITSSTTDVGVFIGAPSALGRRTIYFRPQSPGSYNASSIKTYLSSIGGVIVCYRVEPTTIQITPRDVYALLGNNAISSNVGSVSVQYRADPTLYIAGHEA